MINVEPSGDFTYGDNVEGTLKEAEVISLDGKSRNLPAGTSVVVDKTSKAILSFVGNTAETIAINEVVDIDGVSVTLTADVRVTMDNNGVTVAYLGDIVGTISSTGSVGTTIGSYTYADGAIQFHSNQKVKSGTLGSTNVTNGGYVYAASSVITLYADESVKSGTLAESVSIIVSRVVYHLTGAIAFNADGTVDLANIAEADKTQINVEIHSVGDTEYFFKTGSIRRDGPNITYGVLAVNTPVKVVDTNQDPAWSPTPLILRRTDVSYFHTEWGGVRWETYYCDNSEGGGYSGR